MLAVDRRLRCRLVVAATRISAAVDSAQLLLLLLRVLRVVVERRRLNRTLQLDELMRTRTAAERTGHIRLLYRRRLLRLFRPAISPPPPSPARLRVLLVDHLEVALDMQRALRG